MPHAIIEYSSNLDDRLDLQDLVNVIHQAALDTGVFPLGGLRTRVARREVYKVADGHAENAFVHLLLKIGHGRDLPTRQKAGEAVFEVLCNTLDPVFAQTPLGISFEIQEIDPILNFKKNNLHDYIKQRREKQDDAS